MNYDLEAARLKKDWAENPRWKGIKRGYTAEEVVRLRGSIHIEQHCRLDDRRCNLCTKQDNGAPLYKSFTVPAK